MFKNKFYKIVSVAMLTTLIGGSIYCHAGSLNTKSINGVDYISINKLSSLFKSEIELNGEERNYIINGKKIDIFPGTHFAIVDGQYSMLSSEEIMSGPLAGIIAPGKDSAILEDNEIWIPSAFFKQNDILEDLDCSKGNFNFKLPEIPKEEIKTEVIKEEVADNKDKISKEEVPNSNKSQENQEKVENNQSNNENRTPTPTPAPEQQPVQNSVSAYDIQNQIASTGVYALDKFGNLAYGCNAEGLNAEIGFKVNSEYDCTLSVSSDSPGAKNALMIGLKSIIPSGATTVFNTMYAEQEYNGSFDGWNVKIEQFSDGAGIYFTK